MKKKIINYAQQICQPGKLPYTSKGDKVRLRKITSLVGSNKKVLDLGCYDGTLGARLIKKGNQVYGIEIGEKVAQIARTRGLKVKRQSFTSPFKFKDSFFDVVVVGEVIEHVLDTDFFIAEIKRVLKSKGILVLTTPNVASLGRRIYLLIGKNPYFEAAFGYPPEADAGHIRFFTKNLLLGYLKHKGFKIIKFTSDVINFNSSGSLASELLASLFPNFGRSLIVKAKLEKKK